MATENITNGQELLMKLWKAGIIPEHTRRVVIDIKHHGIVEMYAEMLGSTTLVEIITPENLLEVNLKVLE